MFACVSDCVCTIRARGLVVWVVVGWGCVPHLIPIHWCYKPGLVLPTDISRNGWGSLVSNDFLGRMRGKMKLGVCTADVLHYFCGLLTKAASVAAVT